MLDPQTLVGLHIGDATKLLSQHKASYSYTYTDRYARTEPDPRHPDRYSMLLGPDDVVMRVIIG